MRHDRAEDFEDGEPPAHGRRLYGEHMNTLAQRGDGSRQPEPPGSAVRYTLYRRRVVDGLDDAERALAEATWARLPNWNDLKKEEQ